MGDGRGVSGDVPPGDGGGDDEREKDEAQQPDADQSAIGT
jgi:hypothetical protein